MARITSAQGNRSVRSTLNRFLSASALTATGLLAFTASALANDNAWSQFDDQAGSITIDTRVPGQTNIDQHTQTYIGNSNNLDILQGQSVTIGQNNTGALFVGRSTRKGSDPTRILGNLNTRLKDGNGNFTDATGGSVMVLDRNGVVFGADSRVDVGGIIASTGDITNDDILNNDGQYEFANFGDGKIDLQGSISVSDAGLAAFVSPFISHSGVINAKMGKVAMASGEKVTLDLYGDNLVEIAVDDALSDALIENTGAINAQGGTVVVKAQAAKDIIDSVINMGGVVNASSAEVKGGKIVLGGGKSGKVNVTGTLDASGATGGGSIDVTGQSVDVAQGASIKADAIDSGKGGDVQLIGQTKAVLSGDVSAKGGAQNGDGGFVELSAGEEFLITGSVDTTAANGKTGTFLLDPRDIDFRVGERGLDLSLNRVYESDIEVLSYLTNIDLLARRNFTVNANTFGNSDGVITVNGGNDLRIRTTNATGWQAGDLFPVNENNPGVINLTGNATYGANLEWKTSGNGSITIQGATSNQATSDITLSKLTTQNGNILVETKNGSITWAGDVTTQGGNITGNATKQNTVSAKIGTQTGNINLTGGGANFWDTGILLANNGTLNTASGDINLLAKNTKLVINGKARAGTGDLSVIADNQGRIEYWGAGLLQGNNVDLQSGLGIDQGATGTLIANVLTGSSKQATSLLGTNNEIGTIGNFTTGTTGGHIGGFTLNEKDGVVVAGAVTTQGGDVNIKTNGTTWAPYLDVASTGAIRSNGGLITLDAGNAAGLIIKGAVDATNAGNVSLNGNQVQHKYNSVITANTLTTTGGRVMQDATAKIIANRLTGESKTDASFIGTGNQIGTIGNFTTGSGNWSAGGFTLVDSAGGLSIDGLISTDADNKNQPGGNVDIRTVGNLSIAPTGSINANGGNIDLKQTGTFSSAANTLKTKGTGTINVEQRAGGSINQAVQAFDNSGTGINTALVHNGTYNENVLISDSNVHLVSANGRANTTIIGDESYGGQGTVEIANGANNVKLGDYNKGFKIVGFDSVSPGLEKAAVYIAGAHENIRVIHNEIEAKGEAGLLTEEGGALNNVIIDSNIFSGQTFVGANPASGDQFDVHNVPRALLFIGKHETAGDGNFGANKTNITVSQNQFTGTVGGVTTGGVEVSNTAVTVDAHTARITGNTFNATVKGTATALRARGTNTLIKDNTFDNANLGATAGHLRVNQNVYNGALVAGVQGDINDIWANNTFIGNVTTTDNKGTSSTTDYIGYKIQSAVNEGASGALVSVSKGTFDEGNITLPRAMTVRGDSQNTTIVDATGYANGFMVTGDLGFDNDVVLNDLSIKNAQQDGVVATDSAVLKFLQLNRVTLENNGHHGVAVYGNGAKGLHVQNSKFLDNGWGGGSRGEGDILAYNHNGDVFLKNVTIENNSPAGLADYGVQVRGADGFGTGKVTLDNVNIAGSYRAAQLGIQRYGDLTLSMNNVTLGGQTTAGTNSSGWGALYLSELGANALSIGNTAFKAHAGQYITLGMGAGYNTINAIDATNATFEGLKGSTATRDQNFAIEDKIFHKLDNAGQGVVTWHAGNTYVTQASGSIQRGVDASNAGGTVWVDNGTFTEQVSIGKNLTLTGSGVGQTIVQSPSILAQTHNSPNANKNYGIIHAHDADNIVISNLTVDGSTNAQSPAFNDNNRFIGVIYENAGGTLENTHITNIKSNPSNRRSGFGVLAFDDKGAVSNLIIRDNTIDNFQKYGIALANAQLNATVTGNTITGDQANIAAVQSGIFVTSGAKATIDGNTITDADVGVELTDAGNTSILDNTIENGASHGILASGTGNKSIVVAGNTLRNNKTGAEFQSGTINLSGVANTISGGDVGLRFDPKSSANASKLLLAGVTPDYNGGTIGSTVFEGLTDASDRFIVLVNGAFFDLSTGTPKLIDARNTRFNGLSAADDATGRFRLYQEELDAIEAKTHHFVDDNTLGRIFYGNLNSRPIIIGVIPNNQGIDQEDVMQYFSPVNLQFSSLNVTVNGMPSIPGGAQALNAITPFAGGNNDAASLNSITPAAGGHDTAPSSLNAIETAAGGSEVSCWGDAAGAAGNGQIVNISYNSSAEGMLNAAAACKTGI